MQFGSDPIWRIKPVLNCNTPSGGSGKGCRSTVREISRPQAGSAGRIRNNDGCIDSLKQRKIILAVAPAKRSHLPPLFPEDPEKLAERSSFVTLSSHVQESSPCQKFHSGLGQPLPKLVHTIRLFEQHGFVIFPLEAPVRFFDRDPAPG